MPKLRTETIGTGDMSWLDSAHGLPNARTVTIDISAFTAGTHYPNGYIPSGTPVALVSAGIVGPYTVLEATTTGLGILAGFILTDVAVNGADDFAAPMIDHGRVNVAKVPYASFVQPAAAAKRANLTVVFV